MTNTNENLKRMSTWMEENHLQLVPESAEAIIMSYKRKRIDTMSKINNVEVLSKIVLDTYLGLYFDTLGNFRDYVERVFGKAVMTKHQSIFHTIVLV